MNNPGRRWFRLGLRALCVAAIVGGMWLGYWKLLAFGLAWGMLQGWAMAEGIRHAGPREWQRKPGRFATAVFFEMLLLLMFGPAVAVFYLAGLAAAMAEIGVIGLGISVASMGHARCFRQSYPPDSTHLPDNLSTA